MTVGSINGDSVPAYGISVCKQMTTVCWKHGPAVDYRCSLRNYSLSRYTAHSHGIHHVRGAGRKITSGWRAARTFSPAKTWIESRDGQRTKLLTRGPREVLRTDFNENFSADRAAKNISHALGILRIDGIFCEIFNSGNGNSFDASLSDLACDLELLLQKLI